MNKTTINDLVKIRAEQKAIQSVKLAIKTAEPFLKLLDKINTIEFFDKVIGRDSKDYSQVEGTTLGSLLRCDHPAVLTTGFIVSKTMDDFLQTEFDEFLRNTDEQQRELGRLRERFSELHNTMDAKNKLIEEQEEEIRLLKTVHKKLVTSKPSNKKRKPLKRKRK